MTETPAPYGEAPEARHAPMPWSVVSPLPAGFTWERMRRVKAADGTIVASMPIYDTEQVRAHAELLRAAPELLADLEAYHGAAEDAWIELTQEPNQKEEHLRLIESGRQRLDKTAALIRRAKGGGE